jgi:hypothetical protein
MEKTNIENVEREIMHGFDDKYTQNLFSQAKSGLEAGRYSLALRSMGYLSMKIGEENGKRLVQSYLDHDTRENTDVVRAHLYCGDIGKARQVTENLLTNSKKKSREARQLSYCWNNLFGTKAPCGKWSNSGVIEESFWKDDAHPESEGIKYSLDEIESRCEGFQDRLELNKERVDKTYRQKARSLELNGHHDYASDIYEFFGEPLKARRVKLKSIHKKVKDLVQRCNFHANEGEGYDEIELDFFGEFALGKGEISESTLSGIENETRSIQESYKSLGKEDVAEYLGNKVKDIIKNITVFHSGRLWGNKERWKASASFLKD